MDCVNDYLMVTNLIPKQLCKSLIIESAHLNWEIHSWYDYTKDNVNAVPEKNPHAVLSTPNQFQNITKYLVESLGEYQKKYSTPGDKTGGKWINKITPIKFVRYDVGTYMHQHYDHIQSIFDGKLKGIPIISIVGLLNDNFEGGEFMCRGKEIKLAQGDILLFPSNFMFPHEVKEITKGIRYSFVSWAF